jgi:hypothetical protein
MVEIELRATREVAELVMLELPVKIVLVGGVVLPPPPHALNSHANANTATLLTASCLSLRFHMVYLLLFGATITPATIIGSIERFCCLVRIACGCSDDGCGRHLRAHLLLNLCHEVRVLF